MILNAVLNKLLKLENCFLDMNQSHFRSSLTGLSESPRSVPIPREVHTGMV